jgi:hypothetical protein
MGLDIFVNFVIPKLSLLQMKLLNISGSKEIFGDYQLMLN